MTLKDIIGHDDFVIMKLPSSTARLVRWEWVAKPPVACFDAESLGFSTEPFCLVGAECPPGVFLLELNDDEAVKVQAVLQRSGRWDHVYVLEATLEERCCRVAPGI